MTIPEAMAEYDRACEEAAQVYRAARQLAWDAYIAQLYSQPLPAQLAQPEPAVESPSIAIALARCPQCGRRKRGQFPTCYACSPERQAAAQRRGQAHAAHRWDASESIREVLARRGEGV